jgi:membrane-bound lytic murein transglycosylase A
MRHLLLILSVLSLVVVATGCKPRGKPETGLKSKEYYEKQLLPGQSALEEIDISTLPTVNLDANGRSQVRSAIARSLVYLATKDADKSYPVAGLTKTQVVRSLQVLDEMLAGTSDEAAFNADLRRRFRAFMSVGCDGMGTVLFTGYCTPIYEASLGQDANFRYPIYRRPNDLVPGTGAADAVAQQRMPDGTTRSYPARADLAASHSLQGLEFAWFRDPFDAYSAEIEGSVILNLPTGGRIEGGNDGTNGHPYHSIARDLVDEGKIAAQELSLVSVRAYFRAHPDEVAGYINRNPRVAFFKKVIGGPFGKLGQPVTTDVSVATDKSIFPPGAPLLCATGAAGANTLRLDQDAGGAIRAPGRCDLFMGIGEAAEARAGAQLAEGRMYFLIAKE